VLVTSNVKNVDLDCRNRINVSCDFYDLFKSLQVKRHSSGCNSSYSLFIYDCCRNNIVYCPLHMMIKLHKNIGDYMKWKVLSCLLVLISIVLSGCMYPDEELVKNQIPYKDQIQAVQTAVDTFKKDNGGILPIKTKDATTPIYQKYPIEFKRITPKYLAEPPGNAFENGGVFQYVLVDVETNPTVKLFDLRMVDTIRDIKLRIKANGYPPFKTKIANNVFSIDYKQLGYEKAPYVVSPFSNQNLPFVITGSAEVYVDYRADLYQALKKTDRKWKQGEDIRSILVTDSMFVPAYSLPYTVDAKTKEPIFLEE
jgi:hypothetical protein